MEYRYRYINRFYVMNGSINGEYCNPCKKNDKNISTNSKTLVEFEDGTRHIVLRRCLRLVTNEYYFKCNANGTFCNTFCPDNDFDAMLNKATITCVNGNIFYRGCLEWEDKTKEKIND